MNVPLWRGRRPLLAAAGLLAFSAGGGQPLAAPLPLQAAPGLVLLSASTARADYGPLAEAFETQANLAYCGAASSVMVLNSLAIPAPSVAGYGSYRFWTQQNLFEAAAARAAIAPETVARQGMTLAQLQSLLQSHGLRVNRLHGDGLTLVALRTLVRRSLADPDDRLLVNYDRRGLGQQGGGHISPLAAYDASGDRVLILDVARYRYPSVWVELGDLLAAMRSTDASSGRSRGLLIVRRQ